MAEVRQLKERGMEVCGLKLCPGTPYLASGEDNGRVSIWDLRMVKLYTIINAHTACAKVTMQKYPISITYTHTIEKCTSLPPNSLSYYRPASKAPFKWRFAGGPIAVHFYMVTGLI